MARQSVNMALDRIRQVMYAITKQRRWSPSEKCMGNRVTVHGATRHTSAALLLFHRGSSAQPPSESVIMEIQQRSDLKVFRQHYYHCDEQAVKEGLEFAAVPSPWKKKKENSEKRNQIPGNYKGNQEDISATLSEQKKRTGRLDPQFKHICRKSHLFGSVFLIAWWWDPQLA